MSQVSARLADALEALPPRDAHTLVWLATTGATAEQLSQRLGVDPAAARVRIERTQDALVSRFGADAVSALTANLTETQAILARRAHARDTSPVGRTLTVARWLAIAAIIALTVFGSHTRPAPQIHNSANERAQ